MNKYQEALESIEDIEVRSSALSLPIFVCREDYSEEIKVLQELVDKVKDDKKTISLYDDQIVMIIGALERSGGYYFDNCTDQSVDDEWSWLNMTIEYLKEVLEEK